MKRTTPVLLLLALLAAFLAPGTAQAASPPVKTGYSTSPLNDSLAAAISSAPCSGGRVDILLHNTGDWTLTKAVIDRANCGTKVRLITWYKKDDRTGQSQPLQLAQTQMRNAIKAHGGTFVACKGACLLNGSKGIEHEKVVAVWNGRQYLVMSDSGNWTESNDRHGNDRMTVDDKCLYSGTLAHMDQAEKDRAPKKPIRFSQSCDGKVRIYWNPVANADPALDWAKKARCGKGATVVWANSIVSQGKTSKYGSGYKLATELIRFKKAGAKVSVATNKDHWSRALETRLSKAGIIITKEKPAVGYRHYKLLAAIGCATGPFLEQGSTTRNSTAITKNGNQTLVSVRSADAAAAVAGFTQVITRW